MDERGNLWAVELELNVAIGQGFVLGMEKIAAAFVAVAGGLGVYSVVVAGVGAVIASATVAVVGGSNGCVPVSRRRRGVRMAATTACGRADVGEHLLRIKEVVSIVFRLVYATADESKDRRTSGGGVSFLSKARDPRPVECVRVGDGSEEASVRVRREVYVQLARLPSSVGLEKVQRGSAGDDAAVAAK